MVRAGPHVGERQGPEVHNRQAIGINGALGLLGHKVIHHAQKTGGQKEPHRVMAIPPLHHRILYARVSRVRLPERYGHFDVVHNMQNRDRQNV